MNIYDISEKAGVSIATVSRVLNNSERVSPQTRAKVLAVMAENDYVPNAFARGLGLKSMQTIGLLCPINVDAYLAQALGFLEQAFRERGYNCLLSCTGNELDERRKGVELLAGKHVDGMVLMGSTFTDEGESSNLYLRDAAEQIPLVLLNGSYPCANVYCVSCNDRQATMEAVQYLADTGRRRILYLYHNKNYRGQRKLAGYRDGLESRGLPPEDSLIRFYNEDRMSVPDVRDDLVALDRAGFRFDAVMTSDDLLAVGAAKYAHVMNRAIPESLSIIGYNNSSFCLCCEPELTSVDCRLQAICHQCVATMLAVLTGEDAPQRTIFTAELAKRGSTL